MSMPSEPNSKIASLLKTWARKRRAQAGTFELHPATRKLFQNAVAQKYPAQTLKPAPSLWQRFWPQLAFGCGLAAFIAAALLWPGKTARMEMAQVSDSKKARTESTSAVDADKPAPPANGPVGAVNRNPAAKAPLGVPAPAAPPPAAAPAPSEQPAIMARSAAPTASAPTDKSKLALGKERKAESAAAPAPQPASRALAFQRLEKTDSAVKDLRVDTLSGPPDVLAAFTVQRDGQKVRVTDSDGSVYEGEIVSNLSAMDQRDRSQSLADEFKLVDTNSFAFRVSGTSKRLELPIIFSGTVSSIQSPTGQGQTSSGFGGAAGGQLPPQSQVSSSGYFNVASPPALVSGKVKIGDRAETPIQAKSGAPGKQ